MAQKSTAQETRLGISYLWDNFLTNNLLQSYNFFYQSFFEIYKVLTYRFRFLFLDYSLNFLPQNNLYIYLYIFLKKKKLKIKKLNIFSSSNSPSLLLNYKNLFFFKLKTAFSSYLTNSQNYLFFLQLNKFKQYSLVKILSNINFFKKFQQLKFFVKTNTITSKFKKKQTAFLIKKKISLIKNYFVKNSIFLKKNHFNSLLKNWYTMKFFYFIVKYMLLFFFDRLFFKLQIFHIFLSVKNLKYFFLSNLKLKKKLFYLNKQVLPLFFYKKNFFFFSLILTYALLNHSLNLMLESLEKFLRRILGKRHFITHFLNTLRFFKKISYLLAYCFLLRGTIEKHGRTLTFFLIKGKLSLQTFKNIIYYDYIQCYQKYGVFGLHLWIRYQTNMQRLTI